MVYDPHPIDTSRVQIPAELQGLAERLAENSHDLWARRRIAEGWTHGPRRDDVRKTHPDLVPYAELPEEEKEYDREVVREMLKAIYVLGYTIKRL